jgi:hypothetical protein
MNEWLPDDMIYIDEPLDKITIILDIVHNGGCDLQEVLGRVKTKRTTAKWPIG